MAHSAMLGRFSEMPGYGPYFGQAFGSTDITLERVATALADFVRTRKSGDSPYDRWVYGRDRSALSPQAQRGFDTFSLKAGCSVCHVGFNFSDGNFYNLGIGWDPKTQAFADIGREAVTLNPGDRGKFKVPGLREVAQHAPYMHDGSLATLRDVVEFYNRGGNKNPLQSRRLRPLGLSQADVDDVVAFLKSLNGGGHQDRPPRYFPQ